MTKVGPPEKLSLLIVLSSASSSPYLQSPPALIISLAIGTIYWSGDSHTMPPNQEAKLSETSASDGKEAHATQNSQADSTDESAAPKEASGELPENSDAASKARQRKERFKALQARAVSRGQ